MPVTYGTTADAQRAGDGRTDGILVGNGPADKVGFYGVTPVAQQAGATQTALTDSSGGTAADTIAAIGATYTQAEVRNAVASLAAKINMLRSVLVTAGLMKGSA